MSYYRNLIQTAVVPAYPTSLKLFIDAGNPASYSGSGTTVTDLTGNQNGTLINGVGYSASNGGIFTFDGVNDRIDFGINATVQPNTNATFSYWSYLDTNGICAVVGYWNDATVKGFITYFVNGVLQANFYGTGSQSIYCSETTSTDLKGQWYYNTLTFDGSTIKSYRNGVFIVSVAQTSIPDNGLQLCIGSSYTGLYPFNGKISQLKIYNEVRNASDILTDFNEFKSRYGY